MLLGSHCLLWVRLFHSLAHHRTCCSPLSFPHHSASCHLSPLVQVLYAEWRNPLYPWLRNAKTKERWPYLSRSRGKSIFLCRCKEHFYGFDVEITDLFHPFIFSWPLPPHPTIGIWVWGSISVGKTAPSTSSKIKISFVVKDLLYLRSLQI